MKRAKKSATPARDEAAIENSANHLRFRAALLESIEAERAKFRRDLEQFAGELERNSKAAPLLAAALGGHTGIGARALGMIRQESAHEQLVQVLALHAESYLDETTLLLRQGPLELQRLQDRHGRPPANRPVLRPDSNATTAQRGDAVRIAQAIPIPGAGAQDGRSLAERVIRRQAQPRQRTITQHAGLRDPDSIREDREQGRPDPIAPEVVE